MNTNKGSIVKQSGNYVEGCRSGRVLVQPNMRVFLQYSVISKNQIGDHTKIPAFTRATDSLPRIEICPGITPS